MVFGWMMDLSFKSGDDYFLLAGIAESLECMQ